MRAFTGRRYRARTVVIRKPVFILAGLYFLSVILIGMAFGFVKNQTNIRLTIGDAEMKSIVMDAIPIAKSKADLKTSEVQDIVVRKVSKFLLGFDFVLPKSIVTSEIGAFKVCEAGMQPAFSLADIDDLYEEQEVGDGSAVKKQPANIPENMLPIKDVTTWKGNVSGYHTTKDIYMRNESKYNPDLDELLSAPLPFKTDSSGPQVLIVHTHTTEGYMDEDASYYSKDDSTRTHDLEHSVAKAGEEMAKILNEKGIKTLHDKSVHDYPNFTGAYTRSLATIEAYKKKYPSIKVVIDVHRDAMIQNDGTSLRPVTEISGKRTAQLMLVMGTDEGGLSHPEWKENLNFAVKIQNKLNELYPKIARPINLRKERFNQHATPGSLLVEVGSSANTLEQATAAGKCLGTAIAAVLKG